MENKNEEIIKILINLPKRVDRREESVKNIIDFLKRIKQKFIYLTECLSKTLLTELERLIKKLY
jgi:hypothetical protein